MINKFIEQSNEYAEHLKFDDICFSSYFDTGIYTVSFKSPDLYCATEFDIAFLPDELRCLENITETDTSFFSISNQDFSFTFPNTEMLTQFLTFSGLRKEDFYGWFVSENDKVPF
ncbi:hypothetical protein GNP63_12555 [Aliivibrio fischeri]|uniref:hypothetical protein n=1 Tax=Aliivibrio fischeri TaxID=668 RepID=UPI0012D99897|nr:hypothetical protein [Aliivibrio fischeri]MUH97368.1 hypothetical protein [Aliivibrio fischeri]MUI64981.1 hypothetical protein [Aliivibrio fischeri]